MSAALEGEHVRAVLEPLVNERFGAGAAIGEIVVEPVHRRVARYTVRLTESATPHWDLVGKVYETPEFGAQAVKGIRALWDHGFGRDASDGIHVPEVYAYENASCLLLMEDVPGPELRAMMKKQVATETDMRRLAHATAKMHRVTADLGPPFTVDDYLAQRSPMPPEQVAQANPDLRATIENIVATACDAYGTLDASDLAPTHGDYHLGQLHVDGDRLWILDLDRLHRGDSMHDVAMIFVNLKRLESSDSRTTYVREAMETFASTYFDATGWSAAARIPLYAALIHLKKACKHFRWQDKDDWQDRLRQQVQNAADCMAALDLQRRTHDLRAVTEIYERIPAKI